MDMISRESLKSWLTGLKDRYQVMAPVLIEGSHLFRPISSPDEIAWDYYNSVVPPKELVFPITESLFTLEYENGEPKIQEPVIDRETVIFGLRPCDARAIALLDASFLNDPVDTPYARRRAMVTLVGWACTHPETPCFCANVGGAPNGTEGLDVLRYGVLQARRGGLTKRDVANTRPLDKLRKLIEQGRQRAQR